MKIFTVFNLLFSFLHVVLHKHKKVYLLFFIKYTIKVVRKVSRIDLHTFMTVSLENYSMLQYIERVATPKLPPRNCFKYLQAKLIIGAGGWSQNLCEGYLSI